MICEVLRTVTSRRAFFIENIQSMSFPWIMDNYLASSHGHGMQRSDKLYWFSIWRLYRLLMPSPRPTKDVHVLIPSTCKYYLTRQKGLCRCNHVKDFELGDYPGWSEWVQCNHKGPHKREELRGRRWCEDEGERSDEATSQGMPAATRN